MQDGQYIRLKLVELYLSGTWLRNQLEKAGVAIHGPVLSNILSGSRKGPQADEVLKLSRRILDNYEKKMNALYRDADEGILA